MSDRVLSIAIKSLKTIMNSNSSSTQQGKAMTPEQFDLIVGAILSGKYSWACVLILRFAGYNPLHYIPYRTYQRLVKDNQQLSDSSVEDSRPLRSASRTKLSAKRAKSSLA